GASRAANRQFRELISKAIELDPNYAAAHALMAEALCSLALLGWTEFPDRELSRGTAEARKAIALAPDQPDGYRALGRLLLASAEYDQAQNALKRAIEINPSDASALAVWGSVQSFSGEIGAAIASLELALKLDPRFNQFMSSILRSPTIWHTATRTRYGSPSAGCPAIRIFPCSMPPRLRRPRNSAVRKRRTVTSRRYAVAYRSSIWTRSVRASRTYPTAHIYEMG